MNINDMFKFKPTEYGIKRLKEHHDEWESFNEVPTEFELKVDDEGFVRMELWKIMARFGHMMYNGTNKLPFENNEIFRCE